MTPTEFIAKWQRVRLSERSGCQQHFCDLCELLEHPKPTEQQFRKRGLAGMEVGRESV